MSVIRPQVIRYLALIALCSVLLSACALPPYLKRAQASAPTCSELEGYPDCQNGHLVPVLPPVNYAEERARIEDLQARFVLALDSANASELAACFTQDGVLDWAGHVETGRRAIQDALLAGGLTAPGAASPAGSLPGIAQHIVTNTALSLARDKATAQSHWIEMRASAAHRIDVVDFGRYQDDLVKQNGRWLIASRRIFSDKPDLRRSNAISLVH